MNASPIHVEMLFHEQSSTFTYVVHGFDSDECVVIDPCLDIDLASGSLHTSSVEKVSMYIEAKNLRCRYILETHAHADHLTAAYYLKAKHGGDIVIGAFIGDIQKTFAEIYSEPTDFSLCGEQFDILLNDGDELVLDDFTIKSIHVPGHTPACMAYIVEDAVFVGDTLFMPDSGTARCDFPGGDARTLFRSIQRLFELPDNTRVFVCHDYQPGGRELQFESSIAEQKLNNIHVNHNVTESEYVEMRETRDATLAMPKLMLPSLQVNIRAGALPVSPLTNKAFITLPINAFGGDDISAIKEK